MPRCHLRAAASGGRRPASKARRRCPALATRHPADDELASLVADPDVTPEQLAAWTAARRD
ncbi:hypothetical protein ACFQ51_50325 [Streptomyces kaempferi]